MKYINRMRSAWKNFWMTRPPPRKQSTEVRQTIQTLADESAELEKEQREQEEALVYVRIQLGALGRDNSPN